MKKLLLSSIAAIAAATVASAFEICLTSGTIPLPNADGSFSEETTKGHSVRHVYSVLSTEKYNEYISSTTSAADIYADFLSGDADLDVFLDEVTTEGRTRLWALSDYIDENKWWDYDEDACFACVFIYEDDNRLTTNYIARAVSVHTPSIEDDDNGWGMEMECDIYDIALSAGRWEVVAAAPPAPLEIECTNIAVSGGTVTVTYQVSDLSGFAVGSTVNFSVAYSLARNASGALATETLSGTINSIDASASTFTATLSPPANTTSLFILGIDD